MYKIILTSIFIILSIPSFANQQQYEAGFKQGYQLCCGTNVIVPLCPQYTITHANQNFYNDGLRLGIKYGQNAGCNCNRDY